MLSLKDNLKSLICKIELLEKDLGSGESTEVKKEANKKIAKVLTYKTTEEKINKLLQHRPIVLNIGGKKFLTSETTLLEFKDTKLAQVALGIKEEEVFFDRPYKTFPLIMNYLRTKNINLRKLNRFERDDLEIEIKYYGLHEYMQIDKKVNFDLKWDANLSKQGACTVNMNDPTEISVHSTTCYTHFVTDRTWKDEDFVVEFESSVDQTEIYYYFGIVNETYNYTSNCMCCSPANSAYIQCDGNVKINGSTITHNNLNFQQGTHIIGMRVYLSLKQVYFYNSDKGEAGPFVLSGNTFRIVSGHCNTGNGTIRILNCYEI